MSQDNLTIDCAQSGTAYTNSLNSALGSLNSMHAGPIAPTLNSVDGMLWLDTSASDHIMKIKTQGVWKVLFDYNGTDYRAIIPGLSTDATGSILNISNSGIDLKDDKKIIFGDNSDLEIYYNGTNSIINESGVGSLFIRSSSGLSLQDDAGNNFAVFTDEGTGGKCELYKGNAVKMTTVTNGIDVTGSVVASTQFEADTDITSPSGDNSYFFQKGSVATIAGFELAIETGANGARTEVVKIDSQGKVGINTTSPNAQLEVRAVAPTIRITDSSSQNENWVNNQELGKIEFYAEDPSLSGPYDTAFISAHNDAATGGDLPSGALSFGTAAYNNPGGAIEKMRLDSNGNLGIGTGTGVERKLHVSGGTNDAVARFESSDEVVQIEFKDTTGTSVLEARADFRFKDSSGSILAHIDNAGNLGVGVSPETSWKSTEDAIRVGDQGLVANRDDKGITIGSNYKTTDADRFLESDRSARHQMWNGTHKFSISSDSGSAGSPIEWKDVIEISTDRSVDIKGMTSIINETTLGSEISSQELIADFVGKVGVSNNSHLQISNYRDAAGTTWTTAGSRIQQKTDATYQSYIQFNGDDLDHGISFGTGSGLLLSDPVERLRITASGNVGIGNSEPSSKLDVTGNITASGNMSCVDLGASGDVSCVDLDASGDITATSDERLKDNIELIPNAMEKISKLRGVTFTRNDLHGDKTYTGVIAQDVQKVLPEAVQVHRDHLSVAYGNMVGLLIEGMKEQQVRIDELSKEIADLKK